MASEDTLSVVFVLRSNHRLAEKLIVYWLCELVLRATIVSLCELLFYTVVCRGVVIFSPLVLLVFSMDYIIFHNVLSLDASVRR